ncbi:hypothetical protein ACEQPO_19990 [Bacillus sp. SL00103]
MMGQVKIILGNNYGIGMFEVYVIIAIVYWLICMSIELITMLLERKFVKGQPACHVKGGDLMQTIDIQFAIDQVPHILKRRSFHLFIDCTRFHGCEPDN